MSGGKPAPEREYPQPVKVERDIVSWVIGSLVTLLFIGFVVLVVSEITC